MKWNFTGFHNWEKGSGTLELLKAFDVFRAAETERLPRDVCEGCVCWREFGTCVQVQVEDWEEDAACRKNEEGYEDFGGHCICTRNCCPILFFDFIGVKLPVLEG
jgi:hypothetical protein